MPRIREKLSSEKRISLIAKTEAELTRLKCEDCAYHILDELHYENWEGVTVREQALRMLEALDKGVADADK